MLDMLRRLFLSDPPTRERVDVSRYDGGLEELDRSIAHLEAERTAKAARPDASPGGYSQDPLTGLVRGTYEPHYRVKARRRRRGDPQA